MKNKWQWIAGLLFFLAAYGVKWYFLSLQDFYIFLSDESIFAFNIAETVELRAIIQRLLLGCDCNLFSIRPFFTNLLNILAYKMFGFGPQTALFLGAIVGSILVPLYYGVLKKLTCSETAFFSSLVLLFMNNYISQSIALTTILPGIIFITGAIWMAVRYYQGGRVGNLYVSGVLLGLSVFCRYENMLWIPAFTGYAFVFDKRLKTSTKLFYSLLCFASALYVFFCNYHHYGDPFHMVRQQLAIAYRCRNALPVRFEEATGMFWELLKRLMVWWIWVAAVGGIGVMLMKHRLKATWLFMCSWLLPAYLIFKIKEGTLDFDENYFFSLSLVALPVGMEFFRELAISVGKRRVYGLLVLGMISAVIVSSYWTVNQQIPDPRLNYSQELRKLTNDLKHIPLTAALYIDKRLNKLGFYIQVVLVYLGRNPEKCQYFMERTIPLEEEYYLLTKESLIKQIPGPEKFKIKDYRDLGFQDVVLYRINPSRGA